MTPEERVRAFLDAMTEWEPRAHSGLLSGQKVHEGPIRDQLRAIYEEHCSAKGKGPARFGRNLLGGGQGLSAQPKFDQDVLQVEDGPKKSLFYVMTKPRHDPNTGWRFTVAVDAKGVPRIDDLHGAPMREGKLVGEWAKFGY
jgi:hypothetical protein